MTFFEYLDTEFVSRSVDLQKEGFSCAKNGQQMAIHFWISCMKNFHKFLAFFWFPIGFALVKVGLRAAPVSRLEELKSMKPQVQKSSGPH